MAKKNKKVESEHSFRLKESLLQELKSLTSQERQELLKSLEKGLESKSDKQMIRYSRDLMKLESKPNPEISLFGQETIKKAKGINRLIENENAKQNQKNKHLTLTTKVERILHTINLTEGTEFTINEQKALNAIMGLIDHALSNGELKVYPEFRKALLEIKVSDFYDAFGVSKNITGKDQVLRYSGAEKEQAELGLFELIFKVFLIRYEEVKEVTKKTGKIEVVKQIREDASQLISYSLQTEESLSNEKRNREQIIQDGTLRLIIDGVFFHNLEHQGNFFMVPKYINQEIKEALDGKKASPAVYLFNKYLHSIKPQNGKAEITYSRLIEVMNLHKYQKQGRKKLINTRIEEAFEVAIKRNILLKVTNSYAKNGDIKYTLHFNQTQLTEAQLQSGEELLLPTEQENNTLSNLEENINEPNNEQTLFG